MRKKAWIPLLALVAAMLGGCTMSDEDRCAAGYFYVPKIKVCCPEYDADSNKVIWDTGDEETDADRCVAVVPVDTEVPTDSSTDVCFGGDPTGFGVACAESSECAGQEASFCAFNPLAGAGYCSITDCVPGCCPSVHECCDCTKSDLLPNEKACLSNSDADLAVSMASCTCED